MRALPLVFFVFLSALPARAQDWTAVPLGTSVDLQAFDKGFAEHYLVGDGGFVVRSDISQTIWTPVDVGTTADLLAVHQPSFGQVWTGGEAGTVRRLISGVWEGRNIPNATENFVLFTRSSGTSYAVGTGGSIYRTLDGGTTWMPQSSGTTNALHDGSGFIESLAYIVGDGGTILKTLNGGVLWVAKPSGTTADLYAYQEVANGAIVVAGEAGTILRSTDLGESWTPVASGTTATLYDVDTSGQSAFHVLAVGEGGTILRSTNAGVAWCPIDSETTADLFAADMILSTTKWIVAGAGGYCAISTNAGGGCDQTGVEIVENTAAFRLAGPWPQPITGAAHFECEVDRSQRLRADLIDVSGRRLQALLDAQLSAGDRRVIAFDAGQFPAGVYFLRVEGAEHALTRRIVVVR